VEFSKKSKIILLFSIIVILVSFVRINTYNESFYSTNNDFIYGKIIEKRNYENRISFVVKGKEKILVNCYECNIDPKLGSYIKTTGTFKEPNKNSVFNLFNYRNYLKSKKINWIFNIENFEIIENNNIFYNLKNNIINRVNKLNNKYLNTFILGNNELDDDIYSVYQSNGISHLFAVSGMHISLITLILITILKRITKNKKILYLLVSIFLIFYMFLTNFSPSVIRSSLLFIGLSINKVFKLDLNVLDIVFIILDILLIYNPYYFYNISFLFSFTISIYLIISSSLLSNFNNYFIKILIVSIISFIASLPIVINNFFTINLLSPIINVIAVPLISFIIFPLAIITFIFPLFNPLLNFSLNVFENISMFFSQFSLTLDFGYINTFLVLFYYILITNIIIKFKKYKVVVLIIFVTLMYFSNYFNVNPKITFIDVGQGDSILLQLPHNKGNILIDTGGNKDYDLSKNTIIPYLKSSGIKKIDLLILTHGDFDHMGSSINLVNNFKVEQVIFNSYKNNDLENSLIEILKLNKIKYSNYNKNIISINGYKLHFLNQKHYDENEDSLIIYAIINNRKILLMGDAGIKVEEDILNKYNINYIDILKVGHHGSKTSSSEHFIDTITPKYSVISVGKNNRYGHPNKEILENLEDSEIYRTDQNGSIMFKIKNNKLKIKTCPS